MNEDPALDPAAGESQLARVARAGEVVEHHAVHLQQVLRISPVATPRGDPADVQATTSGRDPLREGGQVRGRPPARGLRCASRVNGPGAEVSHPGDPQLTTSSVKGGDPEKLLELSAKPGLTPASVVHEHTHVRGAGAQLVQGRDRSSGQSVGQVDHAGIIADEGAAGADQRDEIIRGSRLDVGHAAELLVCPAEPVKAG